MNLERRKSDCQARGAYEALLTTLHDCFVEHRPLDRSLNYFFRNNRKFGSRDRQFISEIVFGVFRWWGVLRLLVDRESYRQIEIGEAEFEQIFEPVERAALVVSAQLLERGSVTESNRIYLDYLNIVKSPSVPLDLSLKERLKLFSNFVLPFRRTNDELITENALLPEFTHEMVNADCDLERLAEYLQKRPPLWLRAQNGDVKSLLESLKSDEIEAGCHPYAKNAVCVESARVNLYTQKDFVAGKFEIQDLASQCIGVAAAPRPGERWWDACAGAGGKSLQLADLMERMGCVVASDIRAYKLDDLRRRSRRAQFPNIMCREWDGKALRPRQYEKFDGVLVDAPCSCSGTWRRNPDGRWTLQAAEVGEMAELQQQILQKCAPAVKHGGSLIYGTCSLFRAENQANVERFLTANPEFELVAFPHPLRDELVSDGMLQLYPWDGNCDALFVAKMRRR